jgi:hypothetical protein
MRVVNSDWVANPSSTTPKAAASTTIAGQPPPLRRTTSLIKTAPPPYSGMNTTRAPSNASVTSPRRNSAASGATSKSSNTGAIRDHQPRRCGLIRARGVAASGESMWAASIGGVMHPRLARTSNAHIGLRNDSGGRGEQSFRWMTHALCALSLSNATDRASAAQPAWLPRRCPATQAAIWLRDEKPSLVGMCVTWLATVGLLR